VVLKRGGSEILMIRIRRKKTYPEECILIPIARESKPCIENKCYQWDSEQSKCKLIVAIQK
jgi:hypothetical protein